MKQIYTKFPYIIMEIPSWLRSTYVAKRQMGEYKGCVKNGSLSSWTRRSRYIEGRKGVIHACILDIYNIPYRMAFSRESSSLFWLPWHPGSVGICCLDDQQSSIAPSLAWASLLILDSGLLTTYIKENHFSGYIWLRQTLNSYTSH